MKQIDGTTEGQIKGRDSPFLVKEKNLEKSQYHRKHHQWVPNSFCTEVPFSRWSTMAKETFLTFLSSKMLDLNVSVLSKHQTQTRDKLHTNQQLLNLVQKVVSGQCFGRVGFWMVFHCSAALVQPSATVALFRACWMLSLSRQRENFFFSFGSAENFCLRFHPYLCMETK